MELRNIQFYKRNILPISTIDLESIDYLVYLKKIIFLLISFLTILFELLGFILFTNHSIHLVIICISCATFYYFYTYILKYKTF